MAQIRLPVLGAPGKRLLPKLPADTMLADLHRLGWRTELVLQMPRERAQPLVAEIPLALRQPHDITPPGVSPLLEDADVALSLYFYFLTARIPLAAAQVQHLGSPERLAFGSAPLPRVAKKRPRQFVPFSVADLITCLRQTGHAPPACCRPSPPLTYQSNSQGRGPKDLACTNSQGQGPKHPDVSVCRVVVGLALLLETARVGTLAPEEADAHP